jgi:hypothetical protein
MAYNIYATDFGDVRVSETEAALLASGDWIEQSPRSADNLSFIMPRVRALRAQCEAVAKRKWERSIPAYFWLGAAAESGI